MSIGDSATPLGRVRGLGSGGHGGEHWLADKAMSLALLLLGAWLVASLLLLPSLDRATIVEWLRLPSAAVPMALFVVLVFRHAFEGMKMVIDDYVHDQGNRFALNTLILFVAVGGGALALFSLARISLGAAA